MIVFLGSFPKVDQVDGYFDRIRYIDSFFKEHFRVYVSLNNELKRSFVSQKDGMRLEIEISPYWRGASNLVTLILSSAEAIYIHSIYQVRPYLGILKKLNKKQKRILLDVHGVVPEELLYIGKYFRSLFYRLIEKKAVNYATDLIFVTEKLHQYWNKKYEEVSQKKTWLAPIISLNRENEHLLIEKCRTYDCGHREIIYAGGGQVWQNIELMIKIINESDQIQFKVFSFEEDVFRQQGLKETRWVSLSRGTKEQVKQELFKSHFSFVLRDDHILNRVSCPTKYVEALGTGNIPVVKFKQLGDFDDLGVFSLSVEDIKAKRFPSADLFKKAINENLKVVEKLRQESESTLYDLASTFSPGIREFDSGTSSPISISRLKKFRYFIERNISGFF